MITRKQLIDILSTIEDHNHILFLDKKGKIFNNIESVFYDKNSGNIVINLQAYKERK